MSYEPVVLPLGETVSLCRSHSLTASGNGAGTGCWDRQGYEGIALVYSQIQPVAADGGSQSRAAPRRSPKIRKRARAAQDQPTGEPSRSALCARWRASLCYRTGLPARHARLPAAPAGRASRPLLSSGTVRRAAGEAAPPLVCRLPAAPTVSRRAVDRGFRAFFSFLYF